MKKVLLFLCVLFLVPATDATAFAASDGVPSEAALDAVDTDGIEKFMQELADRFDVEWGTVSEITAKIAEGKSPIGAKEFLSLCLSFVTGDLKQLSAYVIFLLAVGILLSVLKNSVSSFQSQSTVRLIETVGIGVAVATVIAMCGSVIKETKQSVALLSEFSEILFPLLFGFAIALGFSTVTSLFRPTIGLFVALFAQLTEKIVFPLFYFSFGLSCVGNLGNEIKIEKLTKTARSLCTWILTTVFGIFITVSTAQGIVGSSVDSAALQTTEFALSGMIPVVGNSLREGFDLITASCTVIKDALGLCAVFMILLLLLSPMIKTGLVMFALRLTSSVTETAGEAKLSSFLYGIADVLKILLSVLASNGFCILLSVAFLLGFSRGGSV